MPLSSPACDNAWRRFTATKQFSSNERAWGKPAARCFSSACTATGATSIAVPNAANKLAVNSGGRPTNGTSKARKDGSIIVTGSGSTGAGSAKPVPA